MARAVELKKKAKAKRPKGSKKHTTRAKKRGLPRQYSITLVDVGERDGWVCQICSLPIEDHESRLDPSSPCVDHIVPLNLRANTRHGHTWDNVQIAHRRCNEVKNCTLCDMRLIECDSPRDFIRKHGISQKLDQVGVESALTAAQSPTGLVREFLTGFPENGANHGPPRTIA